MPAVDKEVRTSDSRCGKEEHLTSREILTDDVETYLGTVHGGSDAGVADTSVKAG